MSDFSLPHLPLVPLEFVEAVKTYSGLSDGHYAAQLLWKRGIKETELAGFINPDSYQPASPFEFGQEMVLAVQRLQQAQSQGEFVTIWGDFDADGITSTSVLWEGLGQFFTQEENLNYYIPNRFTDSHGLNSQGIERLAKAGTKLIVTCDTGSTNLIEIDLAKRLGIDIIITDHHTLPQERPPVIAIINPRYLPNEHPLYHLSGVAVAYKLVEALYETLPEPQQPLSDLLDLVAIGLIADLVRLSGDCRYLAQRGISRLQENLQLGKRARPGVKKLLELCKRSGDRPTDISFGLGPRINAVSRIQGDARWCVELLTSRNESRTNQLAQETELANSRRKSLQKDVAYQVKQKLATLDLSTTSVIVLIDSSWAVGVLGLVAGQVAQEYGRPTILLSTEGEETVAKFARGSARSVNNIDLYQLVKSQEHLLHRFGGHPFAAGLSIAVENLPMFTEGINQQLRQQIETDIIKEQEIDLVVTVAELGKDLFRELKLLEPCGMGNPVPKLLIQNCWFENIWNQNIKDFRGGKIQYIKTELEICDETEQGFPGIWWEHYKDDVPKGRCDAIVELDFNTYSTRYEVRLLTVRPSLKDVSDTLIKDWLLDWRYQQDVNDQTSIVMRDCPSSWDDLQIWFRRSLSLDTKLALAYPPPTSLSPRQVWEQLVGIAKYLSRTEETVTLTKLQEKLPISDRTLQLGLAALSELGFFVNQQDFVLQISQNPNKINALDDNLQAFLLAVEEEQFRRQYFYQVPLSTIQSVVQMIY